jgi:hypothetical protein
MPVHLDAPLPLTTVDPLCLAIRGWVWLEADHPAIAAIEAHCGEALTGSTSALHARPDVTRALGLPAEAADRIRAFRPPC